MSNDIKNITISSIDQLSWEGLSIDKEFLKALPFSVYRNLCAAFSEVVADPHAKSFLPTRWNRSPPRVCITDGKVIFGSQNGVINPEQSLLLSDFPHLEKALYKTRDALRCRMPSAFQDAYLFKYRLSETRPLPPKSFVGFEASSVLVDVNSIFRNSFSASGKAASFIPISAAVGGAFGTVIGLKIAKQGVQKIVRAAKCGDSEGVAGSILSTGLGVSYAGFSVAMMFGNSAVAAPLGLSSSAVTALGAVANGFVLGMYGFCLASSILGYKGIRTFRNHLTDILDHKGITAKEKAVEGLIYLQQQIGLTESDMQRLKGKSLKEHDQLRNAKWDRFVRRVGADCAQKVALESQGLLEKIRSEDRGALCEAIQLLEMADRESHAQKISQIALFVISILGIAASFFAIVFASSVASAVLFAVGAVLWLLIDSSHVAQLFNFCTFQGDSEKMRKNRWDVRNRIAEDSPATLL